MGKIIFYIIITLVCFESFALPCHAMMESANYSISASIFSGGGLPVTSDSYHGEVTLGQPTSLKVETSQSYAHYPGFFSTFENFIVPDLEDDGIPDSHDNCLAAYNPNQLDTYPPQGNNIGDACDCECDFTCDGDVDSFDIEAFLTDFGRGSYVRPCTNESPCNGDASCDGDVDSFDITMLLEDFGRGFYDRPCPDCVGGDWCSYQ